MKEMQEMKDMFDEFIKKADKFVEEQKEGGVPKSNQA